MRLIAVERCERYAASAQDAGDDLAEATKSCNQHFDVLVFEFVERPLCALDQARREPFLQDHQERTEHHRQRDREDEQVDRRLIEDAFPDRQCEQHECELASGGERESQAPRRRRLQSGDPAQGGDRQELDYHEAGGEAEERQRLGEEQLQVGRHADGHKEEPQQQSLEWLEIRFQLVAKLTIGQQYAGKEGAQGCREPRGICQQGSSDHGEQGCCGKHLAYLNACDET